MDELELLNKELPLPGRLTLQRPATTPEKSQPVGSSSAFIIHNPLTPIGSPVTHVN